MKKTFFFSVLLLSNISYAQDTQNNIDKTIKAKHFFSTINFAIPVVNNPESTDGCLNIDGVILRTGIGAHFKKTIGAGLNIGIDWSNSNCIVAVPMFGNLRFSPKIGKEIRIILDAGYGRSLTLGGSHLSGNFRKLSLGLGDDEVSLYVEINDYGFSKDYPDHLGSLSFGVNATFF